MTLHFESEAELPGINARELAETVIEKALDTLGCPYETEISLLITDGGGIREMNRQFRGIDSETDVLSFPMIDFPSPGDFSFLEREEEALDFNPETGEMGLGDIVINAARTVSQAEEYGHSVKREYAFLITHSVLHLCGFDHMTAEDEALMISRQKAILESLGIGR